MTEGVSSGLRFLVAWTLAALLTVAGCGSPVSHEDGTAEPETIPLEGVRAELVADVARVKPGEYFQVGVLFTIPDRSHIYWRNPGASGLPTGVEWKLAEDVEAGELLWPAPKRFEIEGWDEVSFGYESEVLLFAEVRVPETMTNTGPLSIVARAYWLNCEEDGQCIPGDAELQLEIPIDSESRPSSDVARFEQARLRVPVPLDAGSLPVSIGLGDEASFVLVERDGARILPDGADGPDFFPYEGEAWTWGHDLSMDWRVTESFPFVPPDDRRLFYFLPPDDGASRSGVLVFSVYREDSGTRETFYISMEE